MRNVDELKKAYRKTNTPTHPVTDSGSSSPLEPHKAPPSEQEPEKKASSIADAAATVTNGTGVKTLGSFLDVEKTMHLPPREIESLWRLRHAASPQSLCATIPTPAYRKIEATARKHPQFILPLAREGQGAEIHFLQWTFPSPDTTTVLFTHLAEYKLRGEFAQPHTTVTHHLDMADSKELVLLQGNVMEGRGVSADEARMLLMYLQKFYGMEEKEERARLLRQFNAGDQAFKVEEVIEEAEKII
jgi:ATP synthase mitochondrial F1 complex assembly factor 1